MDYMKGRHKYKESIIKNNYEVINCEECGYWHVYPMPTEEELNTFYESKYYESIGDNRTMTDKLYDPDGFYTIQYEDRLRNLMEIFPSHLPKTVLDIGAGYGDFLRFMKKHGWETQGLEPSRQAFELIKDREILNVYYGSIYELSDLNFKLASLVTLNNVLEHLRDPRKALEIVKKHVIMPESILCIVVPNDFNLLQELLMKTVLKNNTEKQYPWINPPEHLNYYSIKTLKEFLVKCGFRILYLTTDFPMEFFPLMGLDYITHPEVGRNAHLKRVQFEKYLYETNSLEFKDKLFESFARIEIGRDIRVFITHK